MNLLDTAKVIFRYELIKEAYFNLLRFKLGRILKFLIFKLDHGSID